MVTIVLGDANSFVRHGDACQHYLLRTESSRKAQSSGLNSVYAASWLCTEKLPQGPYVIGNSRLYCRGDSNRGMHFAEIVIGEIQNGNFRTRPKVPSCRFRFELFVYCTVPSGMRRAVFNSIPDSLYRLDARLGVRSYVPDPLLRLLAQPHRAAKQILHVLATGRNFSRAVIFISGRNFLRSGNREVAQKKSFTGSNRPHDNFAWRTNPWFWPALPIAGIRDRLGLGPVQRFIACGYPQYDRLIDDADGRNVLDRTLYEKRPNSRTRANRGIICSGDAHFPAHAAPVDDLASRLAAMAARIVHQRTSQSGHATGMALSRFSVERFRFRGTGNRIRTANRMGAKA